MSNLDSLFKNRSLPDIRKYQSAIRNIRKNCRTKGDKIQAIKRQTNYMNLMFNSGSELGGGQGIDASYFINHGDLGLSSFKKADVDYIFSALNMPYSKTKSSILGNVKEVYNVMRYLDFTQPAPAAAVSYTQPQAAHPLPRNDGIAPVGAAPAMQGVPLWRRRGAHPHLSDEPGGVPRAPIPAAGGDPNRPLRPAPAPMMMRRQRRPNPYISNLPGGLHVGAPVLPPNAGVGEAIPPVHMRRALMRFPRGPDPDISNDPGGLAPGRGPAVRRSAPRGGSLPRKIDPRVGGPKVRGGSAPRASQKRKQRSGSLDVAVSSGPQKIGFDKSHPIDLDVIHNVENDNDLLDDDLFDDDPDVDGHENDNVASEHESDEEVMAGIHGPGKTIRSGSKGSRSGSKASRSGSGPKRRSRSPSPMGPLQIEYHLRYDSNLSSDDIKKARSKGMLVGSKSRGNLLRYKDLSEKEQKEWDRKPNVEARKRFMKQCAANREAVGKMHMIEKSNKRLGGKDAMMS